MTNFQHILFPVDFSARSMAARPSVLAMAHKFHAKVTVLAVVQPPAEWYGGIEAPTPMVFNLPAAMEEAGKQLEAFWPAEDAVPFERVVLHGDPGERIAVYAAANQVDLIMMPTRGYGKFRRLLLGSTTAKVLHDAHCPVWTSAHIGDGGSSTSLECRSILCAVDTTAKFAPEMVMLLHRADELARSYDAKLRLVHAIPVADIWPEGYSGDELREFLRARAMETIIDLQKQAGVQLEVCADVGEIGKVVHLAATHHDADLVVIGRGHSLDSFGGWRSKAFEVIRESPCPVLSF